MTGASPRCLMAAVVTLLLLTVTIGLQGQPQDGAPRPEATFRVETRLVEIDVFVTDQRGAFVAGLTQDDFALFENGEPRAIANLSVVQLPGRQPQAQPVVTAASEPARDVITNVSRDGRTFVLILGRLGFREAPRAQAIARTFVEQHLEPEDRLAVVHVGHPEANQAFTSDSALLLASIARACAPRSSPDPVQRSETCPTEGSDLGVLREMLQHLGEAGGRRASVLFISGAPIGEAPARELARLATATHTALYVLDPGGLPGAAGELTTEANPFAPGPLARMGNAVSRPGGGMQHRAARRLLAEASGGIAVTGSNNWPRAMDRAIADASAYYVLAYYAAPDAPGDGERRIDVQVARDDVSVRSRAAYTPPWIRTRTPNTTPPPVWRTPVPSGLSPEIQAALYNPFPLTELPLALVTAPFKGSDGATSVLLGVHLAGHPLRVGPGMRIEVAHGIAAPDAELRGAAGAFTLTLSPSARAAIVASGLRYFDRLELPPGRHELRLVASQLGIAGSIMTHIDVPDFTAAPLAMSGLVIASAHTTDHPTLQVDEQTTRALGGVATIQRRFSADDVLSLFGEIYVNEPLHDRVVASIVLAPLDGDAVVVYEAPLSEPDRYDATRFPFTIQLPLIGLEPGDYVLMVEAQSAASVVPAASRHLRFEVRAVEEAGEPVSP